MRRPESQLGPLLDVIYFIYIISMASIIVFTNPRISSWSESGHLITFFSLTLSFLISGATPFWTENRCFLYVLEESIIKRKYLLNKMFSPQNEILSLINIIWPGLFALLSILHI